MIIEEIRQTKKRSWRIFDDEIVMSSPREMLIVAIVLAVGSAIFISICSY